MKSALSMAGFITFGVLVGLMLLMGQWVVALLLILVALCLGIYLKQHGGSAPEGQRSAEQL